MKSKSEDLKTAGPLDTKIYFNRMKIKEISADTCEIQLRLRRILLLFNFFWQGKIWFL
jgi:hypothetical protein